MRKDRLSIASDVAVLVVAGIVVWLLVASRVTSRSVPSSLHPGDVLSKTLHTRLETAGREQLLLVVLKKGCQYCEGSTPFYKELVELTQSEGSRTGLMALFQEQPDDARRYLTAEDLNIAAVGTVDFRSLKILVTPTVLLVDGQGTVGRAAQKVD